MRDRKNVLFNKSRIRIRDPDPVKILICRIRIRPKMDRIRNPDGTGTYMASLGLSWRGLQ